MSVSWDKYTIHKLVTQCPQIASSYEIYTIQTSDNQSVSGILVSESANSVVLKQAGGSEQTFLRKNISKMNSSPTSLMPEYGQALSPQDCANIIAWLKTELAKK
jgi:putative heme-binding domain-containing protein